MPSQSCPKCSHAMEAGLIVDFAQGNARQSEWMEGPPQTSFWQMGGLKLGGKVRRPVVTYCCTRCGFLESYAQITPT